MSRLLLPLASFVLILAVSCTFAQSLNPSAFSLSEDIAVPDEQELVDRLRLILTVICSGQPLATDLVPYSDGRSYPCPVRVRSQSQGSPSLVAFVFSPRPRNPSGDYLIMASRTDQGWQFSAPAVLGPPLH